MNAAALAVMKELPDITMAYGISDEYRYGKGWRSGQCRTA
jgi:tRNA(His) 5'-end guanylyltransferase